MRSAHFVRAEPTCSIPTTIAAVPRLQQPHRGGDRLMHGVTTQPWAYRNRKLLDLRSLTDPHPTVQPTASMRPRRRPAKAGQ